MRYLEIAEGVTALDQYEFANADLEAAGFTMLEEVILPQSLTSIGEKAFYKAGINDLVIMGNIVSWGTGAFKESSVGTLTAYSSIGEQAFRDCKSLTNVTLQGNGVTIGDYAFWGCTALEKVVLKEGVAGIGNQAFRDCFSLQELNCPNSVTFYGNGFLDGCTGLQRLIIGGGCKKPADSTFSIGHGSRLKYLEIRDGVTALDHHAFANRTFSGYIGFADLETVILPQSLTSIGEDAFYKAGIKNLVIKGNIVSWGSRVFAESSVETLTAYSSIGEQAFRNCKSLKKVTLGGNDVAIGDYAFMDCTELEQVVLMEGVARIGNQAFMNCSSLQALACPDSVVSYGSGFLNGCTGLQRLVIGGGCRKVADKENTFSIGAGSKLKYLEIREGVTTVDQNAFVNRTNSGQVGFANLEKIILPESLMSIGANAFYKAGIKNIVLKGDIISWGSSVFGESAIETLTLYGSVGASAFENCKTLRTVIMNGNSVSIGDSAFAGCSALEQVILNEGVVSIGKQAFRNCSSLQTLECPDSVAFYGSGFLEGCTGLKRLIIGSGCKKVGDKNNTFSIGADSRLRYLEIREGVTAVDQYAFANKTFSGHVGFANLETVILPESLSSIGGNAFYKAGIKNLVIKGINRVASDRICRSASVLPPSDQDQAVGSLHNE